MRECCVCGEEVAYTEGRRKCRRCKGWCHHGKCAVDTSENFSNRMAFCRPCLREEPGDFFKREAVLMNGGPKVTEDPEGVYSIMYVLWCLLFGRAAGSESVKLGVPAESVPIYDRRLQESGVWSGDHLCLDEEAWEDGQTFSIGCIMISLCADGRLQRRAAEQGP